MQADTIGNRLKEVQTKAQDLATFGTFNIMLQHHFSLTMHRQDGQRRVFCAFPRR